ncbi:MAG: DUF420 domain-containing protein [Planctomycetes bacterium]|nr:DUF420 domain-containing protein [Planctomycetota bacterium]
MLLVDARGQVRGTYQGTDREAFGRLLGDALTLYVPPVVKRLPTANAALNSASALLLLVGFLFVKGRRVTAHKVCMVSACASSALFLASYLTYHHFVGSTPFTGVGWIRPVYFAILVSHTVLAALIVPLVLVTLLNAMRARFDRHRAIARWTLPIWLYVSVTGVAVYVMLYGI